MNVYIEYVIIDNLLIDFFILSITKKICKLNTKNILIWLSAFFGTIISIISPYLFGIFLILSKIICSVLMTVIIISKPTIKKFIITYISFLLSTMIMGGACIMFCSIFNIEYVTQNGSISIYNFPVGLALLICLLLYITLKKFITRFYNIRHLEKFIYDIKLEDEANSIPCKAFLDSGNRLIDNKTNYPVILINYVVFSKLFPEIKLADILLKRYKNLHLKNIHELEIKSLSNSSKIIVFEIDNILIENQKITNIVIGLTLKSFEKNLNADCILNPIIFDNS